MNKRQVLPFREGKAEMKALLGGKGANLAEMTRAGLPVPPGFTITTEACLGYFERGHALAASLKEEIFGELRRLEQTKGQRFGDASDPLLVSVRSGAVASMPGMMDTILNLGLNDVSVEGLARTTGQPAFAYDCYRRLIQMFGNVVFGIEGHTFEKKLRQIVREEGVEREQELSGEAFARVAEIYKQHVAAQIGRPFPQDAGEQLLLAVEAVFKSWNNPRAIVYRKANGIPDSQGTAVNIQSMVFGNTGSRSGTGVVFTRNPSTGEPGLYGEYLIDAQGEDVVAGIRTPSPISRLKTELPEVFGELTRCADNLERHFQDMQDIEFTVENGKLYVLQTRNGKRSARAAVKIAVDLVREDLLGRDKALLRMEPIHLDQLLHRGIDEDAGNALLATGLPASPGAAVGQLVFDADTAVEWVRDGKKVILARPETSPEDIHGLLVSEGVLTGRGGLTSHAAVVARGMGKPCVCGCESLRFDPAGGVLSAGALDLAEGDWVTLEGTSGKVLQGIVPLKEAEISAELETMLGWADDIRRLRVRANADTPDDAQAARKLGAEGIGLCRTEHMFFAPERLTVVQEMIVADTPDERGRALDKLLPMQQADFERLFAEMDGLPVTIRLLDPPLHEFLPKLPLLEKQLRALEADANAPAGEIARIRRLIVKVEYLHESNPMLGHRGCRLGIVYPEIYDMQIRALFRAVLRCRADGVTVLPEIMIPLVGHASELAFLRERVDGIAKELLGGAGTGASAGAGGYKVGSMIEVPRAALIAGQVAKHADFFSFGTNDLTQMTLGYSRDDAENKFMNHYIDRKLLPDNPFQVLDTEGVGQLIEWATAAGRRENPALKTGICGEHGGEKSSIHFCHRTGLDYVSCSPYRVPLARIAAAQAAILFGAGAGADATGTAASESAERAAVAQG